MNQDKAIEDALRPPKEKLEKLKTKGRFAIKAATNAGNWVKDKDWVAKANPGLKAHEEKREKLDIELMKKRYH